VDRCCGRVGVRRQAAARALSSGLHHQPPRPGCAAACAPMRDPGTAGAYAALPAGPPPLGAAAAQPLPRPAGIADDDDDAAAAPAPTDGGGGAGPAMLRKPNASSVGARPAADDAAALPALDPASSCGRPVSSVSGSAGGTTTDEASRESPTTRDPSARSAGPRVRCPVSTAGSEASDARCWGTDSCLAPANSRATVEPARSNNRRWLKNSYLPCSMLPRPRTTILTTGRACTPVLHKTNGPPRSRRLSLTGHRVGRFKCRAQRASTTRVCDGPRPVRPEELLQRAQWPCHRKGRVVQMAPGHPQARRTTLRGVLPGVALACAPQDEVRVECTGTEYAWVQRWPYLRWSWLWLRCGPPGSAATTAFWCATPRLSTARRLLLSCAQSLPRAVPWPARTGRRCRVAAPLPERFAAPGSAAAAPRRSRSASHRLVAVASAGPADCCARCPQFGCER